MDGPIDDWRRKADQSVSARRQRRAAQESEEDRSVAERRSSGAVRQDARAEGPLLNTIAPDAQAQRNRRGHGGGRRPVLPVDLRRGRRDFRPPQSSGSDHALGGAGYPHAAYRRGALGG